ncbi:MAG: enoyl-CoA hydratase-related protein [Tissierellales bacterium]
MSDAIQVEVSEKVALLAFNRPEAKNALRPQDRVELGSILNDLAKRADVRAVVLSGRGDIFCAGADLKAASGFNVSHPRNTTWSLLHDVQPALECITRMDKPVIAAINGPAIGVGMSFALACDLMVMDKSTYMMLPFINLGLVPDGGAAWLLQRRVGYARMFESICDARKLDAETCKEWGIANKLSEPGEAVETAMTWAKKLAASAPTAMALTKRLARLAVTNRLEESLTLEAEFQGVCGASAETKEAVAAFMEKRPANFDKLR